jgi:hypothetical protein
MKMIIDDQMHLSWAIGQLRKKRKSIVYGINSLVFKRGKYIDRCPNTFYMFLYKLKRLDDVFTK